jgi:hypothetical protein
MYSACRELLCRTVHFKKRLSNTRRKRLRLRPVSLREAYGLEALRERIYPSKFCGSLVLKSIKRSVINIRCSMLDVRCSTFNLFTVPVRRSFIQEVQGFKGQGFKVPFSSLDCIRGKTSLEFEFCYLGFVWNLGIVIWDLMRCSLE